MGSTVPQCMLTQLPTVTGYINKNIIRAEGSQRGAGTVKGFCKSGVGEGGPNLMVERGTGRNSSKYVVQLYCIHKEI